MLKAESTTRAFAITHDQKFLKMRDKANQLALVSLRKIGELVADNDNELSALDSLQKLVKERMTFTTRYVALQQKQHDIGSAENNEFVQTGADLTDKLERSIASMQSIENSLLEQRKDLLKETDAKTQRALILFGTLATSLFAIAMYFGKKYLAERKESESRFRAVFNQTFQSIGLLTPQGIMLEENLTGLELANVDAKEILGQPVWETPWWGHSETAKEEIKAAVESASKGNLVRFETERITGKGDKRIVDFSLKPAYDSDGKLLYLIAEARDITEAKKVENNIRENELKFKSILSCLAEGLYQVDNQGNLVFMNAAAENMLLYRTADIMGANMHVLIHARRPDGSVMSEDSCPLMGVIKTGFTARKSDDWFRRSDGTFFAVEYVSSALRTDGTPAGAVVAFQDVTRRIEAENRVSEFYSTVSHELRTPLTSIRGALRLMEGGKAGALSERGQQLVSMGSKECDRLVRLINDILDIRKLEAGMLELHITDIDIEDLVNRTKESLNSFAHEANVTLRTDVQAKNSIQADKDRITQVLTNLVSNAVKFSPENAEVLIQVVRKGGNLRFSIIDHGPGISISNQDKLFKMFQQVDSSDSRPKGGTGLGLAISKTLILQHGGTIGVDSKPDEGATFWFELPIAGTPAKAPEEKPTGFGKRTELLIVEDDDSLSSILHMSLVDQFEIRRAANLAETKVILKDFAPKAILLDIHLPDGTGLNFLEDLRACPETADIPVILMSGSEPKPQSYENPLAIDFLKKPFEEAILLQSLQRALKSKLKRAARALIAEDDEFTRNVLGQQLARMGIDSKTVATGEEALELIKAEKFDVLILDLSLPGMDGDQVIETLKQEKQVNLPLLVYTAQDIDAANRSKLTLGKSKHLTKSLASEEEFVAAVRELLSNLFSLEEDANTQSKEESNAAKEANPS